VECSTEKKKRHLSIGVKGFKDANIQRIDQNCIRYQNILYKGQQEIKASSVSIDGMTSWERERERLDIALGMGVCEINSYEGGALWIERPRQETCPNEGA